MAVFYVKLHVTKYQFFSPLFQTLEDEFAFQLEEQERHYGPYLNSALNAEAAAAEGRNSATPTQRRDSHPRNMSRKASSKSSGSERSGSGSRKSSSHDSGNTPTNSKGTPYYGNHNHSSSSGQGRRLSSSRHSLASRGSDI